MRVIRIYQSGPYACGDSIELSANASLHVGKVLRMEKGEQITLFDGENHECKATITEVHKKKVIVYIEEKSTVDRESPCAIHLAQGIAKGDKMEWIIQKATELGVASISPIFAQHGAVKQDKERLDKKLRQWQAIAIGACEQSGRNTIPFIHEPRTLTVYLQQAKTQHQWILDPYSTDSFRTHIKPATSATLLVGPEGGFHADEIKDAVNAHFKPLSLGPRILRTETASIAALSILQALAGDL